MAIQHKPLPLSVFPEEARPYIAHLNNTLRELCALEGVLSNPSIARRSDSTVVRNSGQPVDQTRITPSISSGSGSSTTVGTPALSFGTVNAAGSTTTVVSINSAVAIFGTQAPIGVSTAAAVGSSSYAARADHVHAIAEDIVTERVRVVRNSGAVVGTRPELNFIEGSSIALTIADDSGGNQVDITIGFSGTVGGGGGDNVQVNGVSATDANFNDTTPAAVAGVNVVWGMTGTSPSSISAYAPAATPALVFSTIASAGTSTNLVRTDAQIAIFDGTIPVTLNPESVPDDGSTAKAARRDHVHGLDIVNVGDGLSTFADTEDADPTGSLWPPTYNHVHKSQTSGDWYAATVGKGLVTKDFQGTPRYWRILVQGQTSVVTGGCTLSISSLGVVTATRDSGSSGSIVIRLDDFGTAAP